MFKYLLLLAACVLFCTSPAQAQIIWQQGTGTAAYDESASGGFLTVPGGFLNVGRSFGANNPNHIYLSMLSPIGAILWQKGKAIARRNVGTMEVSGAAVNASTGDFYVTGECTEYIPQHSSSLYSFGMLVKFSATGDTIWSRVVRGAAQSAYAKVKVTANGEAVVIGNNDTDHFIAKFSATGQELWHRSYISGSNLAGYFSNIVLLSGGNILVAQAENYLTSQQAHYLLLDSQGLLLSTHPARSYIAHYATNIDALGNVLDAAGRFYKLSSVGDTLWSRQYSQYGTKVEVRLAVPVPGGSNYLLAGTRPNAVDTDISLLLVNSNGFVLRDTLLVRYGGNEIPTGVQFDAQGNYVVGGWTDDNGPIGHADQITFTLRNWNRYLPTRASLAVSPAYEVYPNPANTGERVRVAVAGATYVGAYEVRDITGRLVQAGAALPAQGLVVADLPAGLYLLRLQQQGSWLPAQRLQITVIH